MCVIIISPRGYKLPTKTELKSAYHRNHDGCGFVSETSAYKSLNFDEFYERLKRVPIEENVIIHFRWATHGAVTQKNCHPFYDAQTRTWFAHNGVLDITPTRGKTDSETAFRKLLVPVIKKNGLFTRELCGEVQRIIGSSRFAFMQDGNLRVFGRFYEYNGCFYSNLYHLNGLRFVV